MFSQSSKAITQENASSLDHKVDESNCTELTAFPLKKDHNSCGVMPVVLGRDITSKNQDGKNYTHAGLLSFLKEHADRFITRSTPQENIKT